MKNNILLIILLLVLPGYSQKQLTDVQKLTTTCKIWGFLKYYHPNVANGTFNWDEQLIEVLPKVALATTKTELSKVYETWSNSLGVIKEKAPLKDSDSLTYFYKNLDLGWIAQTNNFSKKVSDQLIFIKNNRWQGDPFYVSVDREQGVAYPVTILNELRLRELKWSDKNLRLITLFKFWNIINYYYPYQYLMNQNWETSLISFLPQFINVKTEGEFHDAIIAIAATLNDSHVTYYPEYEGQKPIGKYFLPANYKFINNKMVITNILNDSVAKLNNIHRGDAITSIDGKKIKEFINDYRTKISASNTAGFLKELQYKISPFTNQTIEIDCVRNKKRITNTINLYTWYDFNRDRTRTNFEKFQILDDNIGYVNLVRTKSTDLANLFSALNNTKAIVFDLRNYPLLSENDFTPYLAQNDIPFVKQTYADVHFPGRFIFEKPVKPIPNTNNNAKYKGKIIILVDENTHSHAEWLTMYFRTVKNTTIIGSQTSGTDGGVSRYEITIPFKITFTGKGVYYPDGTETQRIGIKPDIAVQQTIEGIEKGKDEILERAIKFIKIKK